MEGFMGYSPRPDRMNLIGSYVLHSAGCHGNSSEAIPSPLSPATKRTLRRICRVTTTIGCAKSPWRPQTPLPLGTQGHDRITESLLRCVHRYDRWTSSPASHARTFEWRSACKDINCQLNVHIMFCDFAYEHTFMTDEMRRTLLDKNEK
eukprot:893867-Pleurochrysis_carterae.AAC.1